MNREMPELEIPNGALTALTAAAPWTPGIEDVARTITIPVVAAELVRLRDELCTRATQTRNVDIQTGLLNAAHHLDNRAAELDPQEG